METVYGQDDFLESIQKKTLANIEHEVRSCIPLDIYCGEEQGKWGIWMKTECGTFLVYCIDLVNSIYRDDTYNMMEVYGCDKPTYLNVETHRSKHCYSWRMGLGITNCANVLSFSFVEYTSKIRSCMEALHTAFLENKPIAYTEPDLKIETIKNALDQLKVTATLPTYYRLTTKDIVVEELTFEPDPEDEYNESISIGIGNRRRWLELEHWRNNYNSIRHQLEMFAYLKEATVEWNCNLREFRLKLKQVRVLDKTEKIGEGIGFKYKEYALVEIQPEEFYIPTIKGYCIQEEALATVYEGFLALAMKHKLTMTNEERKYYRDEPMLLDAYNMFKSPLLERCITKVSNDSMRPELRQVKVKEILRICPDADAVLWNLENEALAIDKETGLIDDVYDKNGQQLILVGLQEWADEIFKIIVKDAVNQSIDFDWKDYHKRGLALAQELRRKLSPDFDLWYEAPFEDKSGTIKRRRLIYELPVSDSQEQE